MGNIRRGYRDETLFWNAIDLQRKLADFQTDYNYHPTQNSLGGETPAEISEGISKSPSKWDSFL